MTNIANENKRDPGQVNRKASVGLESVDNISASTLIKMITDDVKILGNKKVPTGKITSWGDGKIGILKTAPGTSHASFTTALFDYDTWEKNFGGDEVIKEVAQFSVDFTYSGNKEIQYSLQTTGIAGLSLSFVEVPVKDGTEIYVILECPTSGNNFNLLGTCVTDWTDGVVLLEGKDYSAELGSNTALRTVTLDHSRTDSYAYHSGSTLEKAGKHDWEVLGDLRKINYDGTNPGTTVKMDNKDSLGYGLCRPAKYNSLEAAETDFTKAVTALQTWVDGVGSENTDVLTRSVLLVFSKYLLTCVIGDLKTHVDSVDDKLDKKIDSTKNELDTKIDTTKSELENKINTTKEELEKTINTIKENLEKSISDLKADLDQAKIDLQYSANLYVGDGTLANKSTTSGVTKISLSEKKGSAAEAVKSTVSLTSGKYIAIESDANKNITISTDIKTNEGGGFLVLDDQGYVPSQHLPSYVDDVLEGYISDDSKTFYKDESKKEKFDNETGKIYVDLKSENTYRWSGSIYVEISKSLALGETENTAFRGDYGRIAYDHATAKGKAYSEGLYKVTTNSEGHVTEATKVVKKDILDLGITDGADVDVSPSAVRKIGVASSSLSDSYTIDDIKYFYGGTIKRPSGSGSSISAMATVVLYVKAGTYGNSHQDGIFSINVPKTDATSNVPRAILTPISEGGSVKAIISNTRFYYTTNGEVEIWFPDNTGGTVTEYVITVLTEKDGNKESDSIVSLIQPGGPRVSKSNPSSKKLAELEILDYVKKSGDTMSGYLTVPGLYYTSSKTGADHNVFNINGGVYELGEKLGANKITGDSYIKVSKSGSATLDNQAIELSFDASKLPSGTKYGYFNLYQPLDTSGKTYPVTIAKWDYDKNQLLEGYKQITTFYIWEASGKEGIVSVVLDSTTGNTTSATMVCGNLDFTDISTGTSKGGGGLWTEIAGGVVRRARLTIMLSPKDTCYYQVLSEIAFEGTSDNGKAKEVDLVSLEKVFYNEDPNNLITEQETSELQRSDVSSLSFSLESHKLWGQTFDGTKDVSGSMTGVGNLTMSGTLKVGNINEIYDDKPKGPALQVEVNSTTSGDDAYFNFNTGYEGGYFAINEREEDSEWPTTFRVERDLRTDRMDRINFLGLLFSTERLDSGDILFDLIGEKATNNGPHNFYLNTTFRPKELVSYSDADSSKTNLFSTDGSINDIVNLLIISGRIVGKNGITITPSKEGTTSATLTISGSGSSVTVVGTNTTSDTSVYSCTYVNNAIKDVSQIIENSGNENYGTGLTLLDKNGSKYLAHKNTITSGTASEGGSGRTLSFNETFNIPSISYDSCGHITSKSTTTLKLPDGVPQVNLHTAKNNTDEDKMVVFDNQTTTGIYGIGYIKGFRSESKPVPFDEWGTLLVARGTTYRDTLAQVYFDHSDNGRLYSRSGSNNETDSEGKENARHISKRSWRKIAFTDDLITLKIKSDYSASSSSLEVNLDYDVHILTMSGTSNYTKSLKFSGTNRDGSISIILDNSNGSNALKITLPSSGCKVMNSDYSSSSGIEIPAKSYGEINSIMTSAGVHYIKYDVQ